MISFSDISTRGKLFLAFGLMLLGLIAIIAFSINEVSMIRDKQQRLAEVDYKFSLAAVDLKANLNRMRTKVLQLMINDFRDAQKEKLIQEFQNARERSDENLAMLASLISQNTQFQKEYFELKDEYQKLLDVVDQQILLINRGRYDDAAKIGINIVTNLYENIRRMTISISDNISIKIDKDIADVNSQFNSYSMQIIIIAVLLLILIIIITFYLNNLIAKPIQDLKNYSNRIAEGDFNFEIPESTRKDEIGTLWQSFNKMTLSLKEIAGIANSIAKGNLMLRAVPKSNNDMLSVAINKMLDNLNQVIGELKETTNVLNSSTSEIFSGTKELAASVSEIAGAVGETTTTIEEVRRTSETANKNSKEVYEISSKATDYSELGQKATDETREGINKIGNQMTIIADNIIKLSEYGKSIGDIISAVNDIAEQTNLLAVNASIEAARAGEQGKAFAVVAQEIKSLAEQSKQSTMQIKSTLNEIQNAVNSAVLATEQGEKIVESGLKLAKQSGDSIQNLVDTVNIAKNIAFQTSVTSHEQVVGMEQVTLAMGNIKVASSQNATTTKQLEDSAKNLQSLSFKLKDIVAIFKENE